MTHEGKKKKKAVFNIFYPLFLSGFTVNIDRPTYRVRENETSLEVCAFLSNPSSRDIEVTATTKPTSPPQAQGMETNTYCLLTLHSICCISSLAMEDFVSETITFSFQAGENCTCSRVQIVDNKIVETEENFLIMIDTPSNPEDPAPGTRATSTVTIEDDDGKIIHQMCPLCADYHNSVSFCRSYS